jgi:hypothetical protein
MSRATMPVAATSLIPLQEAALDRVSLEVLVSGGDPACRNGGLQVAGRQVAAAVLRPEAKGCSVAALRARAFSVQLSPADQATPLLQAEDQQSVTWTASVSTVGAKVECERGDGKSRGDGKGRRQESTRGGGAEAGAGGGAGGGDKIDQSRRQAPGCAQSLCRLVLCWSQPAPRGAWGR